MGRVPLLVAAATACVAAAGLAFVAPAGGGGEESANPVHVAFSDGSAAAWDFACVAGGSGSEVACGSGLVYNAAAPAANHLRCDCGAVTGVAPYFIRARPSSDGGGPVDSVAVLVDAAASYGAMVVTAPAARSAVADAVRVQWATTGVLDRLSRVYAYCTGTSPAGAVQRVACGVSGLVVVGAGQLTCNCLAALAASGGGGGGGGGGATTYAIDLVAAVDLTVAARSPNFTIVATYADLLPAAVPPAAVALPFDAHVVVAPAVTDSLAASVAPATLTACVLSLAAVPARAVGACVNVTVGAFGTFTATLAVPAGAAAGLYAVQWTDADDASAAATSAAFSVALPSPPPSPSPSLHYSPPPSPSLSATATRCGAHTNSPSATASAAPATPPPLPSASAPPVLPLDGVALAMPPLHGGTTYYSAGIPVTWTPAAAVSTSAAAAVVVWCTVGAYDASGAATNASGGGAVTAAARTGVVVAPCLPPPAAVGPTTATVCLRLDAVAAAAQCAGPYNLVASPDQPRMQALASGAVRVAARVALTWYASPSLAANDSLRWGGVQLWQGGRQLAVLAVALDLAAGAAAVEVPPASALQGVRATQDCTLRLYSAGARYGLVAVTAPFALAVETPPSPSPSLAPGGDALQPGAAAGSGTVVIATIGTIALVAVVGVCLGGAHRWRRRRSRRAVHRAPPPCSPAAPAAVNADPAAHGNPLRAAAVHAPTLPTHPSPPSVRRMTISGTSFFLPGATAGAPTKTSTTTTTTTMTTTTVHAALGAARRDSFDDDTGAAAALRPAVQVYAR